jgi:hypothetical protein
MLQICSGKLFQRDVEYRSNLRGVIYTNLLLYRDEKIDTEAGSLLSTSNQGQLNAIVYELEELIESNGSGKGVLVSHGVDPYIQDFSAIISFALNCTASPSYTLTARLLSDQRGISTFTTPKKIVRRVFDPDLYCTEDDEKHLINITKKLIGLDRVTYLGIMRSIRTYVTGMQRIAEDFELAYTLLVASIESLAQDFDGHKASWSDYDQRKRKLIDSALSGSSDEVSENVRKTLLDIEHTSLGRRFKDFSLEHINPSYYREEAIGIVNPISNFDLPKALSNAYQARSQYIHNLRKLPKRLTISVPYSETCLIDSKPWLTIQGLSRLARHVITEFILRQTSVDKEVYDYSLERSGTIQMPLAPQYWVGKQGIYPGSGSKKLEGFLSQIADHMTKIPNAIVTDLRELLTEVENNIDTLKINDKQSFSALYLLFNGFVSETQRMKNSDKYSTRFEVELSRQIPEALVLNLLFNVTPSWDLSSHYRCLLSYFRTRDNKLAFRAPKVFEAGMILQLAERYRLSNDLTKTIELVAMAVENFPEHDALREFEKNPRLDKQLIVWEDILLPKAK